jgi:sigma-54 specific flagellar transcriptional regulator A
LADPQDASGDVDDGAGTVRRTLQERFPWARIYAIDYPIRFDELERLLGELKAGSAPDGPGGRDDRRAADLVGDSRNIAEIRRMIEQVAPTSASVLIIGESGTGKEVVARQIHERSGRSGPFVAINCSAIPDNLLESELFGHEKGAFTGAVGARAGKFEMAAGGTIFLDEIGDMPFGMQVKLLRVLQERVIERIGGDRPIPVDVRVIAASHRDLPARIESGEFREDLYYRLSVFPIEIAPLRERAEDVRPLLAEIVRRVGSEYGVTLRLPEESIRLLEGYSWPGNVRELANIVERLAVRKPFGRVEPADLPRAVRRDEDMPLVVGSSLTPSDPGGDAGGVGEHGVDVKAHLGEVERHLIESALQKSGGVVARAAELLGVGRTTLVEKMRRYEIS